MQSRIASLGLSFVLISMMGCTGSSPPAGMDATTSPADGSGMDVVVPPGDGSMTSPFETCAACENDGQCGNDARCAALSRGTRVCLPSCDASGAGCAADFVCQEGVCQPMGGSCCTDPDGDGYGVGVDCLGTDCDEESDTVYAGAMELCNGENDDCDENIDEGDAALLCPPGDNVADTACQEGACALVRCEDLFADCNGDDTDGCETPTNTLSDCAECGGTCELAHATTTCETGSCAIDECEANWGDCDGVTENGCELSLSTLTDCAVCGMRCSREHATATCADGSCAIESCDEGYGDCNSVDSDGCETALTSLSDCAACGMTCDLANAEESCMSGSCEVTICDSGWGNCDGMSANGCEYRLNTLTDCGACGTACSRAHANATCESGSCAILSCDRGYGDCNSVDSDGCETSLNTNTNCAACGRRCSLPNARSSCSTGSCRILSCNSGYGDCDGRPENGCEVRLNSNAHCGACGNTCGFTNGTGNCTTGTCTLTGCDTGWDDCDGVSSTGCETSLRTVTDCGRCGRICSPAGGVGDCSRGTCQVAGCSTGYADCDGLSSTGCETSTRTNTDCGGCGIRCAPSRAVGTCATGTCQVSSCSAGWGNCDGADGNGCETSLTSTSNCGSCGTMCSFPNAIESCTSGRCGISGCNSGYSNCDGDTANGCEVRHAAVLDTCGSDANNLGTYDGDRSCGYCGLSCCSNTGWDLFNTRTGTTSAWFRARVREDSEACGADVEHRIDLDVPAGADYDLYVYKTCGTVYDSSIAGTGIDERVIISATDGFGRDDSFTYYIEVRYFSGPSCTPWTLNVYGHNC